MYSYNVWSPHYVYAIDKVESVQRRFLVFMTWNTPPDWTN